MSMLQEFYVFLADLFETSEGPLEAESVKHKLEEGGYDDVTAYDVREAVNLMYEEGDVFESDQSSVLEAYTGGNYVDQSFNGYNIGQAATTGTATSGHAANTATSTPSSGGSAPAHAAPAYTAPAPPPPPPPMDPYEGYTELDAAVQQIVYVSNITNNNTTINETNIDDRDVFEDNDTVVDASIDQTILAAGDVNQDFDTTTVGEEGIAVVGDASGANLVTGDNEGAIGSDGAIVGDHNDDNVTGDGNIVGDENAVGAGSNTGDGNAFGAQSTAGDGNTQTFVNAPNDGVIATGTGGDVEAIQDSAVGAAAFGDGDAAGVQGSDLENSAVQAGDGGNNAVVDQSQHFDDSFNDESINNSFNEQDNSVNDSFNPELTVIDDSFNEVDNSINDSFNTENTLEQTIDDHSVDIGAAVVADVDVQDIDLPDGA